jgi:hypothetical protein
MRNVFYLMLILLVYSVNITAQVTIGSDQPPRAGAGLDLRSNNKGLLLPNVSLTDPATNFQLPGNPATAAGMVIYNASQNLKGPGVYVWDGNRWILITCVPEIPGTIDFSTTIVNLNGTFTASVPEVTGPKAPTEYIWSYPGDLTVTGSATGRSITFTGSTFKTYNAGTITVQAKNACGISEAQNSPMAIIFRDCSAAPATPGAITLSATAVFLNGTFTASVPEVTTGTRIPTSYTWTLPSGLTGSSTTRSITITGATANTYAVGTIKVTATNACGTSAEKSSEAAVTVRVCSAAPATPGEITLSATTVNLNGTFTASVPEVTGTTAPTSYTWTLPSGLTGTSTTRTITITGATAGTYATGTIKVTATNACGTSAERISTSAVTIRGYCSGATVYNGAYMSLGGYITDNIEGAFNAGWTNTDAFAAQNKDLCWATTDISGTITAAEAASGCSNLTADGSRWRLPNMMEMHVLYKALGNGRAFSNMGPQFGVVVNADALEGAYYWSSNKASVSWQHGYNFSTGYRSGYYNDSNWARARCVRTL